MKLIGSQMVLLCLLPSARSFVRTVAAGRPWLPSLHRNLCTSSNGHTVTLSDTTKKGPDPIELLEIRIGKITEINKHPEGDTLYVEKVDLGETTGPRTIVSGLVEYCSIDYLLNRNVVVLCNLKPRALKGITSNGMLLCASDKAAGKVDPLCPPEGAQIGELVTFRGHKSEPVEPGNRATKAFGKICEEFKVNEEGVATYRGVPFMTSAGRIMSPVRGPIS